MIFQYKQSKLILSWYDLGKNNEDKDYYMSFMSYWISFNAICYNLYHKECVNERANIDTDKSKLKTLRHRLKSVDNIVFEETTLSLKKNDRLTINIATPSRLFFSIDKRFTEDLIYDKFVKNYSDWYEVENTNEKFEDLKNSLRKSDRNNKKSRFFIKRMTRIKDYERLTKKESLEELHSKDIIILCEENTLYIIKQVLYQIRCNIFHGEKVPGNVIDDYITKSSLPILRMFIEKLIEDYKINV